MKKKLFLSLIFTLLIINSNAQSDSLSYKNGFWKNGEKLNKNVVKELMMNDVEALKCINDGQTYALIGNIIGCPSAFVFGYDLGHRIGGGQGNNTMLIAGGIGTAIGIMLSLSSQSSFKRSVKIFNKNENNKSESSLNFGITSSGGIGLTFRL